jgi:two-component system response regulator QseB/two-component system response regulator BasR
MQICLIEDDMVLGHSLQSALQEAGYEVVWVRRAADATHWMEKKRFDGMLLDIGLPDRNGMELLNYFRTHGQTLPILLITARDSIEDRLNGLNLGADDYIIKPFIVSEMLARLRAVLRRAGSWNEAGEAVWKFKDLALDERRKTLMRDDTPISLSKSEFALLHTLMQHPDRVLTRSQLESSVSPNSDGQALGVHMSNLRRKIGKGYIRTVHGIGYMLEK